MIQKLCFIFLLTPRILFANSYTIEDLKILHQSKSFEEYLEHYKDIAPTKRDQVWQKMTLDMSQEYVKNKISKKNLNQGFYTKLTNLFDNPFIKNDEFIQYQLALGTNNSLDSCLRENPKLCLNYLNFYLTNSKTFVEIDNQMIDKLDHNYDDHFSDIKLRLTERILNQKTADLYCEKDENYPKIKDYLNSRISNLHSVEETRDIIILLDKNNCLEKIKSKLISSAQIAKNSEREKIFKILKVKNYLSSKEEAAILLAYIMDGPKIGDTFNLAWNKLAIMAQDYKLRNEVLNYLFTWSIIPDAIIENNDIKKRDTIVDYVNKNVPEFFTLYMRECISFYNGKKDYPYGIPTKNCEKIVAINDKKSWVSAQLIKELLKIKKN